MKSGQDTLLAWFSLGGEKWLHYTKGPPESHRLSRAAFWTY